MSSKEDISDMLKCNNYCNFNRIDGQDKMLMFEMCLSGAANCWYLTLPEKLKIKL